MLRYPCSWRTWARLGSRKRTLFISRAYHESVWATTELPTIAGTTKKVHARAPRSPTSPRAGISTSHPRRAVFPEFSWRRMKPTPKLKYIRDHDEANNQLLHLRGSLGFDLEWKPTRRVGQEPRIAVVQLSSQDLILVMQISAMSSTLVISS